MNFEEMINSLCDKEMNERARLMAEAYDKGFKAGRNGLWISLKDELPDFGERVIVTDGVFVGEAYLKSNRKWTRYYGEDIGEVFGNMTHWMQMPVPPKKEKDNEYRETDE